MGLPSSVLSQIISKVKAKIKVVFYIVITITVFLIEIPFFLSLFIFITLQRLSNSQTQRFYFDNLPDFISKVAL